MLYSLYRLSYPPSRKHTLLLRHLPPRNQPLSSALQLQSYIEVLKSGLDARGEVTGNGAMERPLTDFGVDSMISVELRVGFGILISSETSWGALVYVGLKELMN